MDETDATTNINFGKARTTRGKREGEKRKLKERINNSLAKPNKRTTPQTGFTRQIINNGDAERKNSPAAANKNKPYNSGKAVCTESENEPPIRRE